MAPPALRFSHMGVFVRNAARMRDFYERAMGFVVSDEGKLGEARLIFLTRDPDEHHQLVLVQGRPAEEHFNVVNQISFRAGSLAELRALYRFMEREPGVTHLTGRTHGNAWSIYFRDPEGNRIEAFVDSPWHVPQPISEPFDILQDDEAVLAATEARVKRELHGGRARNGARSSPAGSLPVRSDLDASAVVLLHAPALFVRPAA